MNPPAYYQEMGAGKATGRAWAADRCRERVAALAASRLDPDGLRAAAVAELRRAIGFGTWCWLLTDPLTLCRTGAVAEVDPGFWSHVPRLVQLEESDPYTVRQRLSERSAMAAALSAVTGGDLPRSRPWDEVLRPCGLGDELAIACCDQHGCWGWLLLYRDLGEPAFDDQDSKLAVAVGSDLAAVTRRAWGRPSSAGSLPPPGVVIIDQEFRVRSWTASIPEWLPICPRPVPGAERVVIRVEEQLVMQVAAAQVAGRAVATRGPVRGSRFRTASGVQVALDVSPLDGDDAGRIAVTLRPPTGAETFDLACRAYALTPRERQAAASVVAGRSTAEAAQSLGITAYTVKDHLKVVFRKVGVGTRGELTTVLTGNQSD